MTQPLRERTIQRLRDGSLDIVVATDVAARGLDVTRISHVVNYDIPIDTDAYVHRIGRTGRAGREGQAIVLVQPREKRMLHAIERATGQLITPMQLPSVAAVTQRRVAMFKQAVLETIASQELGFFDEVLKDLAGEHEHSMESIAAALAFMVQQERPLQPAEPEIEVFRRDRNDRSDGRDRSAHRGDRTSKQHRKAERNNRHDDRGQDRRAERGGYRDEKRDFSNGRAPGPLDAPPAGSERYRLEVGHDHGAQPKHIAGAIINETGLDGRDVGRIKVHDGYSVVDLPENMPGNVFRRLQCVEIFGHPLRVSKLSDRPRPRPRKNKDHRGGSGSNGSAHGKPMKSGGSFKGKKHAKNGKHAGKPEFKAKGKGKHKKAKQRQG